MTKKKTLGRTILYAMIGLVAGLALAAGVILAITIRNVSDTMTSANRNLNETIGEKSSAYMSELQIPAKQHIRPGGTACCFAGICTLQAASISEDNYFNNLLGNDIVRIAKDIRDAHSKDTQISANQ